MIMAMIDVSSIKQNVKRLYELQAEKKKFDKYYEEVRKKEQLCISNFFFSNVPKCDNSFEVQLSEGVTYYENPVKLRVTNVRTKKVIWKTDKLKEKLGKQRIQRILNKTYTVNDMNGLIAYLKTCGVDPKKFKSFIDVEEQVDEIKLEELYNTGEIKQKEVEGCYKIELGNPYIKITELKS